MKVDPVPEGLDGRDDAGRKRAPGLHLEISGQGPKGAAAEIPQEPPLVLEEDPQHLGDSEDNLAVGDIEEEFPLHPLAPLLKSLGMARRAESPGAAGEHQEPLLATIRTSEGIASLYWLFDEQDEAFEWLERGFEERDHWLCYAKYLPNLRPMRSDPRFQEILRRLRLDALP